RIENFVGQYQDNSTLVNSSQPAISFTRQVDNKYVFSDSDYTERYINGQIAQLPKIIGTTARKASPLVPYPINNVSAGPSEALVVSRTLTYYGTKPTWQHIVDRYEWAGNFSNIAPLWWLGAYHYSDLYMFFGTYLIAPGEITDLEVKTSEKMQDCFLDFITDPSSLSSKGWPEYLATNSTTGGTLIQFGADEQVEQLVDGNSVEGACHIAGDVYNTSP
ncbi:hypothetical protein EV360DRAFT_66362, partial [Lentinula raphanica]